MKQNKERKQVTSCGALVYKLNKVFSETEVLLIKQSDVLEEWGIPKGKMNPGETFEDCAIREVFEETGIKISLEEKLGDYGVSYKNKDKTVIVYFAKQICESSPRCDGLDSEVFDVGWFKLSNLPSIQNYQLPLFEKAKIFLRSKLP